MSLLMPYTSWNLLPSNGTDKRPGITSANCPQVEKTSREERCVSRATI